MISTFIPMLENYFLKTAEISFHASLIIAVLLVIRPLIKRILPPRWVYALWFIVVARLLLVEVPSLPEAISPSWQRAFAVVQSVNGESAPMPQAVLASASSDISGAVALTWPETLAVIWLLGAAILLFHFELGNFRWWRRLAKAPAIQAPEICRLLEECRQEMGVRPVRLVQLPGFASPSMTGLFHPTIILPEDFLERFSPEELRWILLHELAHLKRWDLPVQFLCQILQAVHWFNPLVWLAFSCFRCDRELACDAHVLDRQAPRTSHDYGHVLIKVAEAYPRSFLSPGFLGVSEERTDLQERVEKISRHRRPALAWIVSGIILCALLAFVFLTKATQQAPHQATAKIAMDVSGNLAAELEVMQSVTVVVPTIRELGLDKTWAKRFGSNESALTPAEIMDHMSKILTVKQVNPNLDIVYVTVQDNDPQEAADIANSLVKEYAAQKYAADVESINMESHEQFKQRLADQESLVAGSKAYLEKLLQDPSHPPDATALRSVQDVLANNQRTLERTKADMMQQISQQSRQVEGAVRILAPAY